MVCQDSIVRHLYKLPSNTQDMNASEIPLISQYEVLTNVCEQYCCNLPKIKEQQRLIMGNHDYIDIGEEIQDSARHRCTIHLSLNIDTGIRPIIKTRNFTFLYRGNSVEISQISWQILPIIPQTSNSDIIFVFKCIILFFTWQGYMIKPSFTE